ncbi:MAG: CinY protein, partial [Chloroflexota bacterium]
MTVALVAMLMLATPLWRPSEARAFGTINDLGQRAEHERITRIALGCPEGTPSNGECFEPLSLDQLAGKDGTFGAVGAPDSDDQILDSDAHCDDADFLDVPGYPQSRAEATRVLQSCINHLRDEFEDAVDEADD